MANITKAMHVSKTTYDGVVKEVINALTQNGGEYKQIDRIISLFPEWTHQQTFIAGFTVGRLAEMENQRHSQHEINIFLNSDPDKETEYANKPDK